MRHRFRTRAAAVCLLVLLVGAGLAHGAAPDPWLEAMRRDDAAEAERIARAALADAERRGPDADRAGLEALDRLVQALLSLEPQDPDELATLVERELAWAARLDGESSRAFAMALARRARLATLQRDLEAAGSAAARAAALADTVSMVDADRGEILVVAGIVASTQGRFADAERGIERALHLLEPVPAERAGLVVSATRSLGLARMEQRKLDAAIEALRRADALAQAHYGASTGRRSEALMWLGHCLREQGRYAEGLDTIERAVAIAAAARPYLLRRHVEALRVQSQNLAVIGDLERAGAPLEEALRLEEASPAQREFSLASSRHNLGVLRMMQGRSRDGAALLERALPVYERTYGAESRRVLRLLANLGIALRDSGEAERARTLFERAIEVQRRVPGIGVDAVLLPHQNLGYIDLQAGRFAEARAHFERYLELLGPGRDFAELSPRLAQLGLAAAQWGLGHHAEAIDAALAGEASAQRKREQSAATLGEDTALAVDEGMQRGAELALAIALDAPGTTPALDRIWQAILDGNGTVAAAAALRRSLAHTRGDAAAAEARQDWQRHSDAAVAARAALTRAPSAAALQAFEAARIELDRSERRLARALGERGAALRAAQASWSQVQAALPADTLLVRFVETPVLAAREWNVEPPSRRGRLVALVAARGAAVRVVDLGPTAPTLAAVDAWLALASRHDGDPAATQRAGADVRRRAWDPLAAGTHARRVLVVTTPTLYRINFAALPDPALPQRFLAESELRFHGLNHEREVLLTPASRAAPSLLLAGAPDFGAPATGTATLRDGCVGLRDGLLEPLPGARAELATIRALLDDASREASAVLTGRAASEAAIRAALPRHRFAHLATHGLVLDGTCARAVAGQRAIAAAPAAAPLAGSVPELAALAFAGGGEGPAADGLLTADEIAALDLAQLDWVVLSACDTGLGSARDREGVFGLRRAFRLAGARSLIMSLWKVDDEATAEFMQALYRARLGEGVDVAEAMHRATRAVLLARRGRGESTQPMYWAGFVAVGAWH